MSEYEKLIAEGWVVDDGSYDSKMSAAPDTASPSTTMFQERPFDFGIPRPSGIPTTSSIYQKNIARIAKTADAIQDGDLSVQASSILGSNADYRDIDKAIKVLAFNDRVRLANAKKQADIYRHIENEVLSFSDPYARSEAYNVINDPTMKISDKLTAVGAYKEAYGAKSDASTPAGMRYLNEIQQLEAKPNLGTAERERLTSLKDLYEAEVVRGFDSTAKKYKTATRELDRTWENLKTAYPSETEAKTLSTIDVRNLSDGDRAKLNRVGLMAVKSLGVEGQAAHNAMRGIKAQYDQASTAMDITLRMMEKGKDINMIDTVYKDLLAQYFGYSKDMLDKVSRDKSFMNILADYRHGLYGAALNKTEQQTFLESASSLYRNNQDIALATKKIMDMNLAKMDMIRTQMGFEAFNALYGDLHSNMKDRVELWNDAISGPAAGAKNDGFLNPDEILGGTGSVQQNSGTTKRFNGNNIDELDKLLGMQQR
ncbi:MAG TPA: hypothetical protein CFH81_08880 [Sulfurovum sp. UBA12169]|nr:MAG TPA: hypothetical protein CFH81_08880 [Sulfurovum sp. UBA12169]